MIERTSKTPALHVTLVALVLGTAALGCAEPDEPPDLPTMTTHAAECLDLDEDGHGANCSLGPDCDDDDPEVTGACEPEVIRCTEGAIRECSVKLPTHDDTSNCFVGVEVCADGEWGPCVEADDV